MANLNILNRLLRRSLPKLSHLSNPNSTTLRRLSPANAAPIFACRSIFTRSDDDSVFYDSPTFDFGSVSEIAAEVAKEPILPVRAITTMLDGVHDFTGLPWWMVITCSAVALRATLLPLLVFQLHKLERIGELQHKLPPLIPPLFSAKSFIDHFFFFREKRKEVGCPSYFWYLAFVSAQVPCFMLLLTSIRRMSLNHHPGFDCGGALWFQNLTEFSNGASGSIFPIVVAGLHYANVQISFQTISASKNSGIINVKYFKTFMDLLTLPILMACYNIPQGSLVFWVTNSSLIFIQKLSFKNPSVRASFGLLKGDNYPAVDSSSVKTSIATSSSEPEKRKIYVDDLSMNELSSLSVQLLSKRQTENAIQLLQFALTKDPENTSALILMGQAQLQKDMLAEAIEALERAVSKLTVSGFPTEKQDIDYLIVSSTWAGSAHARQGNPEKGLVHLKRIGELEEPEDPKMKAHYFDGLLMLSSALYNAGRRKEAAKHLRLLAAYNPSYNEFLEQCEKDERPKF